MTLPEATPEDVQEQETSVLDEPVEPDDELPAEASEADAAEQRREVAFDEEDAPIG
jgi:hypothetical protein